MIFFSIYTNRTIENLTFENRFSKNQKDIRKKSYKSKCKQNFLPTFSNGGQNPPGFKTRTVLAHLVLFKFMGKSFSQRAQETCVVNLCTQCKQTVPRLGKIQQKPSSASVSEILPPAALGI